jgi:hypothetical protein
MSILKNTGCPATIKENKGIVNASMYAFVLFVYTIDKIINTLKGSIRYTGKLNKCDKVGIKYIAVKARISKIILLILFTEPGIISMFSIVSPNQNSMNDEKK